MGSFHVPVDGQSALIALMKRYTTTVFIDVESYLVQIRRMIDLSAQMITVLAGLVFVAGCLVLVACFTLLLDDRRPEVAILRAIGFSRAQLKRALSAELLLIGLGAGILAMVLAEAVAFVASNNMLGMGWRWHGEYWLILPLLMAAICVMLGCWWLSPLWKITPLQSLRRLD